MKLICRLGKGNNTNIGHKARNLLFLKRNGFLIPKTHLLRFDAYQYYIANKVQAYNDLLNEIGEIVKPGNLYAIRSSANIEDSSSASYAGQFESVLNISETKKIMETIEKIWESAKDPMVLEYSKNRSDANEKVKMGVIIQEMVNSEYAGIAFSNNPLTGLNETIIECISGGAEKLTQTGITPNRWVKKWGSWIEKPEAAVISEKIINEVIALVKSIENKFKKPVDIEWAYENGKVYILQVREITELEIPVYSNKISKEMLPGIIKPLVWSVNTLIINHNWTRLIKEMVGGKELNPESLTGYFYYRAYFNMSAFGKVFKRLGMPAETLELMMGIDVEGPDKPKYKPGIRTFLLIPRMIVFIFKIMRYGGKLNKFIQSMTLAEYTPLVKSSDDSENQIIMKEIEQKIKAASEIARYNIIIPLISSFYNKVLHSMMEKRGVDFNYNYKIKDIDFNDVRPYVHIADMKRKYFGEKETKAISFKEIVQEDKFMDFVEKFGHFSDSGNDFSYIPWREDLNLIYEMVKNYSFSTENSKNETEENLSRLLKRKPLIRFVYNRAGKYSYYRERISSFYTYGYGALRPLFLIIGKRLHKIGAIEKPTDVFYLYSNEIYDFSEKNITSGFKNKIAGRKAEIQSTDGYTLPGTIFGDSAPPLSKASKSFLKGIPTSHGFYMGVAKALFGLGEMNKLNEGDVLVVPYSDVGWTPLFSKAGAVVAESGGILSHSSIVAREYHIPAVVSVDNACNSLDGKLVSVNGYTGEINIIEGNGNEVKS